MQCYKIPSFGSASSTGAGSQVKTKNKKHWNKSGLYSLLVLGFNHIPGPVKFEIKMSSSRNQLHKLQNSCDPVGYGWNLSTA